MCRVKAGKGIVTFMLVIAFLISGINVYAASSGVTIKNYTAPDKLNTGQSFTLKGKVESDQKISRIKVGIVNSSGKWTAQKYDNKAVNSKTFDLHKADSKIRFGKLKEGTYYYRVYVHKANGKAVTALNKKFTVAIPKPSISNHTYPTELKKGKAFTLRGKVTSAKKIKKIEVGVVNSSGKWTAQKYTSAVNAKTFKISKADSSVHFGKLAIGDYYYRVKATTADGTFTLLDCAFEVIDPNDDGETVVVSGDPDVKLTGCTAPTEYSVGKTFKIKGTITTDSVISRVESGIVSATTNKWTPYKYDSLVVGKTFSLSKTAGKVKFEELAGGTYYYRIYVHTLDGVKTVLNRKFKVRPSNKPQAAVNWAINIANDDEFSYGQKPQTSKVGCYFCGTNQRNKPEGYEKTYVCMTFVHAAYAHGAGDPELLAECKKGKHCLELTEANLTRYSCWEKVGMASELTVSDLMVGDVIVWYSADNTHGHLSIYAGNGAIVDCTSAVGDVWGPNAIALRPNKAASYLKQAATRNAKSYVMRYSH